MPKVRLGHGLYTEDLSSPLGKQLLKKLKKDNIILEFQLGSNVRLNNLTNLNIHPLKKYLEADVKCVQGTDGCGFYGIDTIDEQLALQNLLHLDDKDFEKMRKVEDEVIARSNKYFEAKSKKFKEFLNGRTITEALTELEKENHKKGKLNTTEMRINTNLETESIFRQKVKQLPTDKVLTIIIAG